MLRGAWSGRKEASESDASVKSDHTFGGDGDGGGQEIDFLAG